MRIILKVGELWSRLDDSTIPPAATAALAVKPEHGTCDVVCFSRQRSMVKIKKPLALMNMED